MAPVDPEEQNSYCVCSSLVSDKLAKYSAQSNNLAAQIAALTCRLEHAEEREQEQTRISNLLLEMVSQTSKDIAVLRMQVKTIILVASGIGSLVSGTIVEALQLFVFK